MGNSDLQGKVTLQPRNGRPDVIADLRARGFELWAIWPGFGRQHDGRLLQMDGIFARPERAIGK